jgi:hypothetical protein
LRIREIGVESPFGVTPYIIELHFGQASNETDRRFFNSVQTTLQLPPKTADRLCQFAARELASPEFTRLLSDLRGTASSHQLTNP